MVFVGYASANALPKVSWSPANWKQAVYAWADALLHSFCGCWRRKSVFIPTNTICCLVLFTILLYYFCVGETLEAAIRDKPDGWVNTEGCDSILCLCARETKGSLSQHSLLQSMLLCLSI